MNFSFHNQLNIYLKEETLTFYNTILPSTLQALSSFSKFNQYLALGNGEINQNVSSNCKLNHHVQTLNLANCSFQSDISKGPLFAKYNFHARKSLINCNFITEIGLSNSEAEPTIYNYFHLVSEENPQGIDITNINELEFEVIIYLNIDESNEIIFTGGCNPFFEFLLGNGIDEIFSATGSNFARNERIIRQINNKTKLYPCTKNCQVNENSINIDFTTSLATGELDEILFITNNKVFARKNLKEVNDSIITTINSSPAANYVIKIDSDIKNVNSLTNNNTGITESNYHVSKYANSFGDQVNLPFNNIFDYTSSKFISKDAKLLFFIVSDKVYGYKNENFSLIQLNTKEISDENIFKIISFDEYVFILSKTMPYIETYIIDNNTLIKTENNFADFEFAAEFETMEQADITHCYNNKFLLGLITKSKNALSLYFDYTENKFSFSNHILNNKNFDYVLSIYKNNFCDGQMIYLKNGETSASCRIVTHHSDSSETDIYSYLAYALTNNAKNIYAKGRAVISEKIDSPSLTIYYYPQMYEYNLPLNNNEINNYLSNDLNYIIQELEGNVFKFYNLIGYDTPEEFENKIQIDDEHIIKDIVFLHDSLLVFTNNPTEPVIGFNLKLNKTQIENVSQNNSSYTITLEQYNKLGKNNETVVITLSTRINI